MRIRVTKKDIKEGFPLRAASCPVALALRRRFGIECGVDSNCLIILSHRVTTPKAAADFILRFDRGQSVKPFTFELDYKP